MDGRETVKLFDGFKRHHTRACRVLELEVSHERLLSETSFVLKCPACQSSIRGSISDLDLPSVIGFLTPSTVN